MAKEYEQKLTKLTCDMCRADAQNLYKIENWQELCFEEFQPLGDVWCKFDICPTCASELGKIAKKKAKRHE